MTSEMFIAGLRRTVRLLRAAKLELQEMQVVASRDESSFATEEYLGYEIADLDRQIAKYEHMIELSK